MRQRAWAVALGFLVACSDGTAPPAAVTAVEVSPPNPSVAIGATVQLTAVTRSGASIVNGRVVTWSSSATGVATVSNSGLVTGVSDGTAEITATSEGIEGSTIVTVDPQPVASVTIAPDSAGDASLATGDSLDLAVTTRSASGAVLTGRTVNFTSTNGGVASVNSQGRIRAVSAGSAKIIASSEGKADTANITVVEPYALVRVNGATLPVTLSGLTFTGGRAVLYANGRYRVRTEFASSLPLIDTGTYTVAGGAITMTSDDPLLDVGTGTLSANTLSVSFGTAPNDVSFVFTR